MICCCFALVGACVLLVWVVICLGCLWFGFGFGILANWCLVAVFVLVGFVILCSSAVVCDAGLGC